MASRYFFTALFVSVSIGLAQPWPNANATKVLPAPDREGKMSLDGTDWMLQSAAAINQSGNDISKPSFAAADWHQAKVPGTVLANYVRDRLVPDPNFGNQMQAISEETFQNDFWYRKEFIVAALPARRHLFLNVDGINWKADVYLNGGLIGHIDGAFERGQFEITDKVLPGKVNALAFLIHKCANPGSRSFDDFKRSHNGGVLGKDSPTFLASIGWNWMLSIPGRNIGIWDHVSLQQTGPVMMTASFVHTTVAQDRQTADVTVEVTAKNLDAVPQDATLTGVLGDVTFSQKLSLAANESRRLVFDQSHFPQLRINHPALWWPNGYGDQPLQHLDLSMRHY